MQTFIASKKESKKNLSKELSLSAKRPILAIFLDNEISKSEEKNIMKFLEGVSAIDLEVVILADSNLDVLSFAHVVALPYSRKNRKKLLEATDMALCFNFTDVEELLLNGIIPISSQSVEVKNYNPTRETGNCFVYKNNDPWCVFASVVRAVETFKFPYDWKHIIRQGRASVKR